MKIFNHNLSVNIRERLEFLLTTNRISKELIGNNRSIIFNRAITKRIIDYYDGDEGHMTDRSTGNMGFGFIHYALILNLKPKNVLCIGSRKGFVPSICALACQENGFGQVDFVDAGYGSEDKNHWTGVALWKEKDPSEHFSFLDAHKSIKTHVTTSQSFSQKTKRTYQYIYIDGDHSYKGAKTDYKLFWPRLEKGGLMVFHDVTVKRMPKLDVPEFGVWKFWNEKKGNKITIPLPCSGLGILQK
jgi:hypothetical protein